MNPQNSIDMSSLNMAPLDPFNLDLEQITLIEASAGTGKTYTITTLFARLIAQGYPVESILVVTFTEAAAAELKLRIRNRLAHCMTGEDELGIFFNAQPDPDLIRQRLSLAVTCFDQASIMTIHSFCFATLKENAFESGVYFDMELFLDSTGFFRQVTMDFFMTRINDLDPLFLKFLARAGMTPQRFQDDFRQVVSKPGIDTIPGAASFKNIWDDYRNLIQNMADTLFNEKQAIGDLIQNNKGVDKRSYSKKNLPKWLDTCQDLLTNQGANPVFDMSEKGDPLYKFSVSRLSQKTKQNGSPPVHGFFDQCEELLGMYQVMEENLIWVKLDFLSYFDEELAKMKLSQGGCFFDDLINDLVLALEGDGGDGLKRAVRDRYKACLIDEFQDTDPGQYTIFSRLFGAAVPEHPTPFFMIGDPKQAIYGFRGGDIFAYLSACRQCSQAFTLDTNYRSAPLLVQGVNDLFTARQTPFGFKEIPFTRVSTPKTAIDRLADHSGSLPPLEFAFIEREGMARDRQGFIKKAEALKRIPALVAQDILSILTSGSPGLISKGAGQDLPGTMTPGDMAILVRTNAQADAVQQALADCNIPSFLSKTGSVFDSSQAMELFDILSAVGASDNTGFLKAALVSSLFGFTASMVAGMDQNEALVWKWQDRFRGYGEVWEKQGFVSMITMLFHGQGLEWDGHRELNEGEEYGLGAGLTERALTNFYHLIELVSKAALNQSLSPIYLLKWFQAQLFRETRDATGETGDELRLESDKQAIAIVTIHKSKGLEYPVVFLPYLWAGGRVPGARDMALFHDLDKADQLRLDLGSPDLARGQKLMAKEQEAEEMRLLYVALTRASAHCRIYWGGISGVQTSALTRLVHPNGCTDDDAMRRDLEALAARGQGSIQVICPMGKVTGDLYDPGDPDDKILAPRFLHRQIYPHWRISSFSAIAAKGASEKSEPMPKVLIRTGNSPGETPGDPIVLADFPKGVGAGDFFHGVLEEIDFTDPLTIAPCVTANLLRYGFSESDHGEMAKKAIGQILETSLDMGKEDGFCLNEISLGQRFTELEFCFDLVSFNFSAMADLFQREPGKETYGKRLKGSGVPPFKGFIKGFVDLVVCYQDRWYILDYKSNFLGPDPGDYDRPSMAHAMEDHDYILQYHLYLEALDRYLGLRLKGYDYEAHFGGVFYLFIRGMVPGAQTGVFFDRPSKLFMDEFKTCL